MSDDIEVKIGSEYPETCGCCRQPVMLTPEISGLFLFAPGLRKPYPLIPEEGYRTCNRAGCDSTWRMISRAAEAHPVTRRAGTWTRCVIVFVTGQGADVKNEAPTAAATMGMFGKMNGAKS